MQAGKKMTYSNQLSSLPTKESVFFTHCYQRTMLRFTRKQIHIVTLVEGNTKQERYLGDEDMLMEIERCFKKVHEYKIGDVFGSSQYLYVVLFLDKYCYMATIKVDQIYHNVIFQTPFVEIRQNRDMTAVLKIKSLGSRVIWKVVNGVYEWIVILRAGFSQKTKQVFFATLINHGAVVTVRWANYHEQPAKPHAVVFSSQVPLCFLVATRGLSASIEYNLDQQQNNIKHFTTKSNQESPLPETPFLLTESSSFLIFVKMNTNNTGFLFFIHHDTFSGYKMSKVAEQEILIQDIDLTVKVLEVFQNQVVVAVFNRKQCQIFLKDGANLIKSTKVPLKKELASIEPAGNHEIFVMYENCYQIQSLLVLFNITQPVEPASSSLSYSHTASSESKDKSATSLENKFNQTSKVNPPSSGVPSIPGKSVKNAFNQLMKNSIKNKYSNSQQCTQPKSTTEQKDSSPTKPEEKVQREEVKQTAEIEDLKKEEDDRQKQLKINLQKEKISQKYNRVEQAIILQGNSEDEEGSSPSSSKSPSIQPITNEPMRQGQKNKEMPISGTFTPPKQANNSPNQFISFGPDELGKHNSAQHHPNQNFMSFGVKDVVTQNQNIQNKVNKRGSQDQIQVPQKINKPYSFGKDNISPKVSPFPKTEKEEQKHQIPLKQKSKDTVQNKQISQNKVQIKKESIEEIQWKMNELKEIIEIKQETNELFHKVDKHPLVHELYLEYFQYLASTKENIAQQYQQYCKNQQNEQQKRKTINEKQFNLKKKELEETEQSFHDTVVKIISELGLAYVKIDHHQGKRKIDQKNITDRLWKMLLQYRGRSMNLQQSCEELILKCQASEKTSSKEKSHLSSMKEQKSTFSTSKIRQEKAKSTRSRDWIKQLRRVHFFDLNYRSIRQKGPLFTLEQFDEYE